MQKLTYIDIPLARSHLNDKALYRLMGYKNNIPNDTILDLIESLAGELTSICKAHAGYKIVEGKRNGSSSIICDGIVFHTGTIIADAMDQTSMTAVFTVTLGNKSEEWLEAVKMDDNIMHEFVANSIASVFVDGITEVLISFLKAECDREGLNITNNYSPGYCGWPLEEQRLLFPLLPDDISGITLTDSCLMLPIKSVSGIIGIGKDVIKKPYGCAVCTMRGQCNYH